MYLSGRRGVLQVMSRQSFPAWFDPQGMGAWVEGMSRAFGCQVSILDSENAILCSFGDRRPGPTRTLRLEIRANGRVVGWVELVGEDTGMDLSEAARQGIKTLGSLAEARNSLADLAETNAVQWMELSVLYRSSSLLRGGLEPEDVSEKLLEQIREVLPSQEIALLFELEGRRWFQTLPKGVDSRLEALAQWGRGLDGRELIGEKAELCRLGFDGDVPEDLLPALVIPLCVNARCYGALVAGGEGREALSSQHLKLAGLLVDQAALAFANIELLEKTREHERLRHELELASEIQNSILPPPERCEAGYEISSICQPTTWVGGDAYVLRKIGDTGLMAGVADVSGHGISAALLMNAFVSHLEALSQAIESPGALLSAINDLVTARVGEMGMFITVVLLKLEEGGKVRVADGGHPQIIAADARARLRALEGVGLPMGILETQEYPEYELDLEVGGALLVYSDGLMEARNAEGEMYGLEGIMESFRRCREQGLSARDSVEQIRGDLMRFTGSSVFDDDLTIQIIERVG